MKTIFTTEDDLYLDDLYGYEDDLYLYGDDFYYYKNDLYLYKDDPPVYLEYLFPVPVLCRLGDQGGWLLLRGVLTVLYLISSVNQFS